MKNESFFEKKGFYIILFLCVCAIGTAGYVNFGGDDELVLETPTVLEEQEQAKVPVINEETGISMETLEPKEILKEETKIKDEPKEELKDEPKAESKVTVAETPKVEVTKEKAISYMRPVSGEIINANSKGELVLDETMNVWRTHDATDYKVTAGTNVLAIADGTVRSITTDDLYGTIITIEHNDGLITKTYGLDADVNAQIDKKVVCGDVLGKALGVFSAEEKLGEHIHVEAIKDGVLIDVETLF